MSIFILWHREHPDFRDNSPATLAAFPNGFIPIAEVETDAVGEIFQLTNNIYDVPWVMNPEPRVKLTPIGLDLFKRHGGIRSTSVGDVYTIKSEHASGRWSVDGIGLSEF